MSEYRFDPLTGQWVIIAQQRAERPSEFLTRPLRRPVDQCPFCAGNESLTPPTLGSYPPGSATWEVRVFANKYPAVVDCRGITAGTSPVEPRPGLEWQRREAGHGRHEIVVESPRHTVSFTELTPSQACWTFVAYRDCLRRMAELPGLRHALVFKNCGGGGGATLEHSHSQVLATSLIPTTIELELRASADYFRRTGHCIFCDLGEQERAAGERLVAMTDQFLAYCPYASRFPYELWIVPRQHTGSFISAKLGELEELSGLFQRLLRGLEKNLSHPPYNFWIHSVPFDSGPYDHYHWHIELIPRITTQAGFEWGTGCFINPVAPEEAAQSLRGNCDLHG